MKTAITTIALVALFALSNTSQAQDRIIRAKDLTSAQWSEVLSKRSQDIVLEFRKDDEIPVSFGSEGDLIETSQAGVSYVKVKRNFWIKPESKDLTISLDGTNYKPFNQALTGSFSAGASSEQNGGPINAIQLIFKSYVK